MKIKDAATLWNMLMKIKNSGDKVSPKFAYAVNRNLSYLKTVIEELEKKQQPSAEYFAYNLDREEIAKKYSKKDEQGKPKTVPVPNSTAYTYDLDEAFKENYIKEINDLIDKNKKTLDEQKVKEEKVLAFVEEDREVSLHLVSLDALPAQISVTDIEILSPIILE